MADILHHPKLLAEINAFLSETGMGASYFGRKAVGNSELVSRLKNGGRVWPETEKSVRKFIKSYRVHTEKRVSANADIQGGTT